MSLERWDLLNRWLSSLPADVVENDPELLLTRAWIEEDAYRYTELLQTLARVERLVAEGRAQSSAPHLGGEIDALASGSSYLGCQGPEVVELAQRALTMLPLEQLTPRGFALALLGFGHQMCGDAHRSEAVLQEALQDRSFDGTTFEGLLLTTLSFVHWMEADIPRLVRTARDALRKAEENDLAKSASYARYLLGIGLFEAGELEAAQECLEPLLSSRLNSQLGNCLHGTFALALISEERGRSGHACELAEAATARALEARNSDAATLAIAFQAELALRQGRLAEALAWARTFEPSIHGIRNRFFQPEITFVKVRLVANGEPASEETSSLLCELRSHLESLHARRHLIDVLLLQALHEQGCGNAAGALSYSREAVKLASPRGVRLPFHDLGPELAELLGRLDLEDADRSFVDSIPRFGEGAVVAEAVARGNFRARNLPAATELLVEPFTERELDVLTLLAERLSNKEIAARLGISPATIKRHNANIFDKLQVQGGRREAVAKAERLGILSCGHSPPHPSFRPGAID